MPRALVDDTALPALDDGPAPFPIEELLLAVTMIQILARMTQHQQPQLNQRLPLHKLERSRSKTRFGVPFHSRSSDVKLTVVFRRRSLFAALFIGIPLTLREPHVGSTERSLIMPVSIGNEQCCVSGHLRVVTAVHAHTLHIVLTNT